MLPWRVEVIAGGFLLLFLVYRHYTRASNSDLTIEEKRFIVYPLVGLIGISTLSMLWSASPLASLQHALTWSIYLTFYLCLRRVIQERSGTSRVTAVFVVCLGIFALLAGAAQLTLIFVGNSTAIGVIYSKFAEQAITIFPLVLLGTLRAKGRRFHLALGACSLLWLLVFCSSSRASIGLYLVTVAVFAVGVVCFRSFRPYRVRFALICIAVAVPPVLLVSLSSLVGTGDVLVVSRAKSNGDLQSSNEFRLLMIKLGARMFTENPLLGVGANNFGYEVNRYRAAHSAEFPSDPLLAQAETTVPERTHNEFLQIAAELGVVGIAIFAWFLVGIGMLAYRSITQITRAPYAAAAVFGALLFLVSSLVTSYSFRLVQNGFTFLFVLAIAARILMRTPCSTSVESPKPVRFPIFATAACVALIAICGLRVMSSALTHHANSVPVLADATHYYEWATYLDKNNPDAPYALGRRLIDAGQFDAAVPHLQESIKIGMASSADYSYLATAQSLSGDDLAAERTFGKAARLYPRSTFVLTRYAVLLETNGHTDMAQAQFARASGVDLRSANTWRALMTRGARHASDLAFRRDDFVPVMDLYPDRSLYAVVEERDIRFPDERVKLPFEKALSR
ncbi:MAG TPA: O-antigen ligase family protein [Pyrinomonadaceae bacterium]